MPKTAADLYAERLEAHRREVDRALLEWLQEEHAAGRWPTIADMAEEMGCARSIAKKRLQRLIDQGMIVPAPYRERQRRWLVTEAHMESRGEPM